MFDTIIEELNKNKDEYDVISFYIKVNDNDNSECSVNMLLNNKSFYFNCSYTEIKALRDKIFIKSNEIFNKYPHFLITGSAEIYYSYGELVLRCINILKTIKNAKINTAGNGNFITYTISKNHINNKLTISSKQFNSKIKELYDLFDDEVKLNLLTLGLV